MNLKFLEFLEKNPKLIWFLIFLYMGLIFYFSSLSYPPQPIKGGYEHMAILEHVIEFGILGALLLPGFRSLGCNKYALFFAILVGIFYGISDEIHQAFVPMRDASFLDVIVDSVGTIVGVIGSKIGFLRSSSFSGGQKMIHN